MLRTKQDYLVKIEASFRTKSEKLPLSGNGLKIKLWDQDLFVDDFIEEVEKLENGTAAFSFILPEQVRSFDSPCEVRPDLYLIIEKHGDEIYRTPVKKRVDFHIGKDSDKSCFKEKIDLGMYEIPDSVLF